MKRILATIGLGLLGVALAVGVTMAASNLSSQSIGISAEPTTAGEQLAVPRRTTTTPRPQRRPAKREAPPKVTPPVSRPAPAPPTVTSSPRAAEPGEDRGRGGDDRSGGDNSGSGSGSDDSGSDRDSSGSGKSDDD